MNNELIGGLHRRDFMKLGAMGVGGVSASGWMNVLAGHAAETQAKHKSCILLYMSGGPSHKDTFDLKPDSDGAVSRTDAARHIADDGNIRPDASDSGRSGLHDFHTDRCGLRSRTGFVIGLGALSKVPFAGHPVVVGTAGV